MSREISVGDSVYDSVEIFGRRGGQALPRIRQARLPAVAVKIYDVPVSVLQIVEDALSYELRPALGKIGGNNT